MRKKKILTNVATVFSESSQKSQDEQINGGEMIPYGVS